MRLFLALILFILPFSALANGDKPVDVAIVVSFDRSESIDKEEAEAQISGLVYTLRHPRFHAVVSSGYYKRIALSALTWSSFRRHELLLPWALIASAEQAEAAAGRLERFLSRPDRVLHRRQTDVAFGIEMATEQLHVLPWRASKKVINMVGDGISNIGRIASVDRDAAVARGITVNGLIMAQGKAIRVLSGYFKRDVIGGPTAFLQVSANNKDFARAMLRKVLLEMVRLRDQKLVEPKKHG